MASYSSENLSNINKLRPNYEFKDHVNSRNKVFRIPDVITSSSKNTKKDTLYYKDKYISSGTFGYVYRYVSDNKKKNITVKILSQKSDDCFDTVKILKKGVKATGRNHVLSQRCITGKVKNTKVLVMQTMDGNLSEFNYKQKIPYKTKVDCVIQLIQGLRLIKEKLSYLDVKPANFLYKKNKKSIYFCVGDLDVCHASGKGHIVATYWPPEHYNRNMELCNKKATVFGMGLFILNLFLGNIYKLHWGRRMNGQPFHVQIHYMLRIIYNIQYDVNSENFPDVNEQDIKTIKRSVDYFPDNRPTLKTMERLFRRLRKKLK